MAALPDAEPRSRVRIALMVLAPVVGIVALVAMLAALRLRSVHDDLRAAEDLLEVAGDHIEQGRLAAARSSLAAAQVELTAATGSLHNRVELDLIGFAPVISDNLDELRRSVAVASQLTAGGERILAAAGPLEGADGTLEVPLSRGAIPLDAVQAVQLEAEQLAGVLPGATSRGGGGHLLGPVRELRDRVLAEAIRRRDQLDVLSRGLDLIAEMSGGNGERHYLIAVANTAEMRGSGGMILSYGALVGQDGDFALESFGRIDELLLSDRIERGAVPTVPDDYLTRWAGFDPLERWRNANLSGDFELTAPVLEQMYLSATGIRPDGVIQIDPQGLAAILAGTGPVEVPELGTVDADNVVDLVLNEAYERFPSIEARSDVLGEVAEATFTRLVEGQYDSLRPLAEALLDTVAGRHLLMHSVTSGPQNQLRYFGAAGAVPDPLGPDAVQLTVQNVSANKLDYFLDTSLDLTGERPAGAPGRLRAVVTLANRAPPDAREPRYVFGPFDEAETVGVYRGVVSLYLPAGTSLVDSGGDPLAAPPVLQTEGGRPVVGFNVEVPAGQQRTVVLDLALAPSPPGRYSLLLVPSPRVRPTTATVQVDADGPVAAAVTLDRTWRIAASAAPEAVRP